MAADDSKKYEGYKVLKPTGGRGKRRLYWQLKDPDNPEKVILMPTTAGYMGKDGLFHYYPYTTTKE